MSAQAAIQLEIHPDAATLARRVASWIHSVAREKDGRLAIALSGGATPRQLYEQLSTAPIREAFPWSRVHWFWSDERFVLHSDPLSNFGMAQEMLFSRVPVPASNIHPVQTALADVATAAEDYDRTLRTHYGADVLETARPLFDITILGLGIDGHTASLFSGTPALDERQRWATASESTLGQRITLTYPAIESSRHVAFLVTGASKRAITSRLLRGEGVFPANRLRPIGSLYLFGDTAAVSEEPQKDVTE